MELPDFGKWITGFIDVTRWIKDIGTLLRIVAIVGMAYVLLVGGIALWKRWIPVKKEPKPPITTGAITGGDKSKLSISSGDRTNKFGILTF